MATTDYNFSPFAPTAAGCTELCPDELFTWTLNSGTNFDNATSVALYFSTTQGFNPALGAGTLIDSVAIEECPTPSGGVVINEIMHNPNNFHNDGSPTDPYTGEWVELAGAPGTDIGCYILSDGDWAVTLPPGTVIPASGYFTIGYNEAWLADGVTFDLDLGVCNCYIAYDSGGNVDLNANFIFTNSGEWLILFDANTVTYLDGLEFGSPSGGNSYPNGFLMTVAATTGVFPQVAGLGCIPNALNIFSFPASLPTVPYTLGNADEHTIHRDADYTGSFIEQNNFGGTLGGCNTPSPPNFPFVIDSSFNDTYCGQTLYVTGIVQTDCGMNDYAGQLTSEYEICIVCPDDNITGTYCPDYSTTVGGTIYDSSNPNGTTILSGVNGDCDTTVTVNLMFYTAVTASLSSGGTSCPNSNYSMDVSFAGDAPFTFVYSINSINQPVITTSNNPYVLNIPVGTVDLNIQLVSISDVNGCSGVATGNETITVSAPPSISIGPDITTCSGQTDTIPFTFTGTAPFQFNYTVNGTSQSVTTSNNPYYLIINPTFNSTYVITSFSDDNCAGAILNSIANVTVNSAPFVTLSVNNANVCTGDDVEVSINVIGVENYVVDFMINNVPQPSVTFDDFGYIFTLNPSQNTTVILTSIQEGNGCTFPLTESVFVNVAPAPTANITQVDTTLCSGASMPFLVNYTGNPPVTLYYSLDGVQQPPVTNFSGSFSINAEGMYSLDSIVDNNCSNVLQDSLEIIEVPDISVINLNHTCNFVDGTYTVTFDIEGGSGPGTYTIVNSGIGTLTGDHFVSTSILSGVNYTVSISDQSGCGFTNIMGSFDCNCPNFSGVMPSDTIHICLGEDLTWAPTVGSVTTATDTIAYIIHDLPGTTLGTIYATTYDILFASSLFLPPNTETVYYISAVTGPVDGNGLLILTDPCTLVAPGTPFIIHDIPDFSLINDVTVCPNDSVDFHVLSSGNAPFDFTYTFAGATNSFSTSQTDYILNLGHLDNQQLIVNGISDQYCSVVKADTVDYNTIPTISYLNLDESCDFANGIYTVSFDLLGGQGSYYVNGDVLVADHFMSTNFVANTNYYFEITSDAHCDTIYILGLQSCDCPNDSGTMPTDTIHLCDGEDLNFDLASNYTLGSNDTIVYIVHDLIGDVLSGNTYVFTHTSPIPAFTLTDLNLDQVYYVSAVTGPANNVGQVILDDDCTQIASTPFIIHSIPTVAMITNSADVCEGECASIAIQFVGTPPFVYSYTIEGISVIDVVSNSIFDTIEVCADDYLPLVNASLNITSINSFCPSVNVPEVSITFYAIQYADVIGEICQGDTIDLNGVLYHENNLSSLDTTYNGFGCIDFINNVTYDLLLPTTSLIQNTYCENDTIIIGGEIFHQLNTSGVVNLDGQNADGCDSVITVDLTFLPIINASIQGDTSLCEEANVPISLVLPAGVTGDITFMINTVPVTYNNVSNGFTFDINVDQDTDISIDGFVTATPNCGITNIDIVQVGFGDVNVDIFSMLDYGGFEVSCNGGDGALGTMVTDGEMPISYLWSNNSISSTIDGLEQGTYSIIVEDNEGCLAYDTMTISQAPGMEIYMSSIDPLCFGDASGYIVIDSITGSNGPFYYQLVGQAETLIENFPTFVPSLGAGVYEISIRDTTGCQYLEEMMVNDPIAPFLVLVGDAEIELGDSTLLTAETSFEIDTFYWSPASLISCDTCLNTWATPLHSTNFIVTAVDTNGCTVTSSLLVTVTVDRTVFIPTVFTPNGDGINDYVFIQGSKDIEEISSFSVFSRWGEMLYLLEHFQPNVYGNGWDGRFHGQDMNVGVFMYQVEVLFKDGETRFFEGDFTLIR